MTSYTLLLLGLRLTKLNKVVPFFLLTNFVKCLNCTVNAILTFFWKESFFFFCTLQLPTVTKSQVRLNYNISVFICFCSLIYKGSAIITIKILTRSETTQNPTTVICQNTMDSTFQKHQP